MHVYRINGNAASFIIKAHDSWLCVSSLVSTETMAYAHSHQIILGDGAGHRYTYIMTDFSSTAYTEVAMGKYVPSKH